MSAVITALDLVISSRAGVRAGCKDGKEVRVPKDVYRASPGSSTRER